MSQAREQPKESFFELWFQSGESSLSVRSFKLDERLSALFTIDVVARTESPSLDLDAIVGHPAGLAVATGYAHARGSRSWEGVVSRIAQVEVEPTGLSTYELRIVPALWLLTQRRDHRIFQHVSIPDIALELLHGWGLDATLRIDRARYPKLEYKVQYGESDHDFLRRILAEAGITFFFEANDDRTTSVVLSDEPQSKAPLAPPIPFVDEPNRAAELSYVTRVQIANEVRPGAYTLRDFDFRKPAYALFGEAPRAPDPEKRLEQYHYSPGAFLVETGRGGDTPVADDRGVARHDAREGQARAARSLEAERTGKRSVTFETNLIALHPGTLLEIEGHPHPDVGAGQKLLVASLRAEGGVGAELRIAVEATLASVPYRPAHVPSKPAVHGVQSAIVVGPPGDEIHTDEFGRVRVQFPWDRQGHDDDRSSCWIRVGEGWAGTGYGLLALPRVGHEVLVAFLAGDPDQPIIVGRVFNATARVPYKLPEHKTRSTWQSRSSPRGEGYNEIMFEDLAGHELVYEQAERDRRRLVKNDEVITVHRDREKLVKGNEVETTRKDRTEVTDGGRTELTRQKRTTVIGGPRSTIVKADSDERVDGSSRETIAGSVDQRVGGALRERVGGDASLEVGGSRAEKTGGSWSLTAAGDHLEKLGGRFAVDSGGEIHYKTASQLVIEVGQDFTIKAPGGFIRVNAEGVTIKGSLVKINSGGSSGSGGGSSPAAPQAAQPANVAEPPAPEPDDVGRSPFVRRGALGAPPPDPEKTPRGGS